MAESPPINRDLRFALPPLLNRAPSLPRFAPPPRTVLNFAIQPWPPFLFAELLSLDVPVHFSLSPVTTLIPSAPPAVSSSPIPTDELRDIHWSLRLEPTPSRLHRCPSPFKPAPIRNSSSCTLNYSSFPNLILYRTKTPIVCNCRFRFQIRSSNVLGLADVPGKARVAWRFPGSLRATVHSLSSAPVAVLSSARSLTVQNLNSLPPSSQSPSLLLYSRSFIYPMCSAALFGSILIHSRPSSTAPDPSRCHPNSTDGHPPNHDSIRPVTPIRKLLAPSSLTTQLQRPLCKSVSSISSDHRSSGPYS